MRRQSGFTLIELLLVLAIIGIINAIAIPALLNQRARSRDKAVISTVVGQLDGMVGQYDKAKEQGLADSAILTALSTYMTANIINNKNAWDGTAAFSTSARQLAGNPTQADFEAAMAPSPILGRGRLYVQFPANGDPGFMGVVTTVKLPVNGTTTITKSVGLD